MEGVETAVHRFPHTGGMNLTIKQRTRYLVNSKTVIAQLALDRPDVRSVDFDGVKLHNTTGTVDLLMREVHHKFALVMDLSIGKIHRDLVNDLPPSRHMVRELAIAYRTTAAT